MKATFSNTEKLKSKKLIEQLFAEGQSVSSYPLRLVFVKTDFNDNCKVKAGVSVSKRHFKKAVDRNRIKRLMREAYRLNKSVFFNNITTSYALMILYIGSNKPNYIEVEASIIKLFKKFGKAIETHSDHEEHS